LYNNETIKEPELDEYFKHDRAVRESGHDTTYRLEGRAAHLCTVDLNSLLYKYETDIADTIKNIFNDKFGEHNSSYWYLRAEARKANINKYLYNKEKGMFFDYNFMTGEQSDYESATTFYPLWARLATEEQAHGVVRNLKLLEVAGGIVSGTEKSRGEIGIRRPNRQWDFPYGWVRKKEGYNIGAASDSCMDRIKQLQVYVRS
jgi:alpha,alpha-trehalase